MSKSTERVRVEAGIYRLPNGRYLVRTPIQRGSKRTLDVTWDTLAEARAFKATAELTRSEGGVVAKPARAVAEQVPTFLEFTLELMDRRARKAAAAPAEAFMSKTPGLWRAKTFKSYRGLLNHQLKSLHNVLVCDIDRPLVEELAISLAQQGYAVSTVTGALLFLAQVLEEVPEKYLPGKNPARKVHAVPPSKPCTRRPTVLPRILTFREIASIVAFIRPNYRLIVWAASLLSLRYSEIAGLDVGAVSLEKGTVTVRKTRDYEDGEMKSTPLVKTSAAYRELNMCPSLAKYMAAYIEAYHGPYRDEPGYLDRPLIVQTYKRGHGHDSTISESNASDMLIKARNRAGLGFDDLGWPIGYHAFRKSLCGVLEQHHYISGSLRSQWMGHEVPGDDDSFFNRAARVTLSIYSPPSGDPAKFDVIAEYIEDRLAAEGVTLDAEFPGEMGISVADAAGVLGCTPVQVRRAIRRGQLPATVDEFNGVRRYRLDPDIVAAEAARITGATPDGLTVNEAREMIACTRNQVLLAIRRGRLTATEYHTIDGDNWFIDPASIPTEIAYRATLAVNGITTAEAADRLGITVEEVRRALHGGRIHGARDPNQHGAPWSIDPDSLDGERAYRAPLDGLTVTEASKILGLTNDQIKWQIHRGTIPAAKRAHPRYRRALWVIPHDYIATVTNTAQAAA